MIDKTRRKELVEAYAERKPAPGVFAVRGPGQVWTATSRDLAKAQNGIWFSLRQDGYINREMQALWNAHGEAAFSFEILEEIATDNPEMIGLLLKEHEAMWRAELGARKLHG
jgi:hypothetical protein